MKTIPVGHGRVALVDDQDYDDLVKLRWHSCKWGHCWYAKRSAIERQLPGKRPPTELMHRRILGPGNYVADHINGDALDNRRCNLRKTTQAMNCANRIKRVPKTSRFKGVSLDSRRGTWFAKVGSQSNRQYLGTFKSETEAALAYNKAASKTYGEFARLNVL